MAYILNSTYQTHNFAPSVKLFIQQCQLSSLTCLCSSYFCLCRTTKQLQGLQHPSIYSSYFAFALARITIKADRPALNLRVAMRTLIIKSSSNCSLPSHTLTQCAYYYTTLIHVYIPRGTAFQTLCRHHYIFYAIPFHINVLDLLASNALYSTN